MEQEDYLRAMFKKGKKVGKIPYVSPLMKKEILEDFNGSEEEFLQWVVECRQQAKVYGGYKEREKANILSVRTNKLLQ